MKNWIWEQHEWPHFYWDPYRVLPCLAKSRLAQGKILGYLKLLDPNSTLEAVASILVEDSITTSAIEGEKLDLDSVRSSVARHLGLPMLTPNIQSRAVEGIVQILIDATSQFNFRLTMDRLKGWQAALFPTGYSGLHKIKTGELRGNEPMQVVSGRHGQEKIHFIAPPRSRLEAELNIFLDWFNQPKPEIDGLIRAGLAHLWFITLHPFEDGNGRLTRAITDMAIAQDEQQPMRIFSLSSQILKEREAYYDVLEQTQRQTLDVSAWLVWFLTQVQAACIDSENIINKILTKVRFWIHFQNVDLNERQRKVINRLLDVGIEEFEGGMNVRKYMGMTKTSRTTASRELTDLVNKSCLRSIGKGGRSSAYEINF